jgi:hypothetical protein
MRHIVTVTACSVRTAMHVDDRVAPSHDEGLEVLALCA